MFSSIADTRDEEQVLRGIQPKNQLAFRLLKVFLAIGLGSIAFAGILFGVTYVEAFKKLASYLWYRRIILVLLILAIIFLILTLFTKLIFLRKAKFDDWVFEVANRKLGTNVIFYTSKYIFVQYDVTGKEIDKREFVSEMSDKSENFSYFYVNNFVDQQVMQIKCTRRQPIPKTASFHKEEDIYWNVIPLGVALNSDTQKISPIAWNINDQNTNENFVLTPYSNSILISGRTGCYSGDTKILVKNNLI